MRIDIVAGALEPGCVRNALEKENTVPARLREIDGQLGKRGTAGRVGLDNFRAARKESDIGVVEALWRDDLRDPDFPGELLQQARVFLGFEKRQPADRKRRGLDDLSQLFPKR